MSVLFLCPNSGVHCPQELENVTALSQFDIFMESSSGIDHIFDLKGKNYSIIRNEVSSLFIDLDRHYEAIYPISRDGVIKYETHMGKEVFQSGFYPDAIAISNILKRYYFPLLKNIKKIMEEKNVKLMVNCKSQPTIYPKRSKHADNPAPIVEIGKNPIDSRRDLKVLDIAEELGKRLSRECDSLGEKFKIKDIEESYIFDYFNPKVPIIEIVLNRALYINDRDFDLESMTIDTHRLKHLSDIMDGVFSKFYGNL